MWNKKAEKLLSIWWIFVLVVIGGAVVIGVLIYFNAEINVKQMEADILSERIIRCLTENGHLRPDFLKNDFNVFTICGLKKEVFDDGTFYFKISVYNDAGLLREDIIAGDPSFEENCEVSGVVRARYFPKCSEKDGVIVYSDGEDKEARLKVLAGSDQEIRKVGDEK